jgi:hypothetical protein
MSPYFPNMARLEWMFGGGTFVCMVYFFAVPHASRVRNHVAESEKYTDVHALAFNLGVMPVPRVARIPSARAVALDLNAPSQLATFNHDRGAGSQLISVQDSGNDPKPRADWTSTIGEWIQTAPPPQISPEVFDAFNYWLSVAGNDASLPTMTRSSSFPARHGVADPVMSAAVLERPVLERAPPAPPPPSEYSGGGGGGDDDSSQQLKLVSPSEAVGLLEDWIGRTRVYKMSGQFGNQALAETYAKSLDELEVFRLFCQNQQQLGKNGRTLILGLYTNKKPDALAGGSVLSARGGVILIKHLSINPIELHDDSSGTNSQMRYALHLLADEIDIRNLVISPDVLE